MEIKVLGAGCSKCKTLLQNVETALKELGVSAKVEKVEDIAQIVSFGIMSTPALVIDGKVVLCGRVAGAGELKKLIEKNL